LADCGSLATTETEGILGELSQEFCRSLPLVPVIEWNCRDNSGSVTKEVAEMCESKSEKGCTHPERLKGKPGECSAEQIKECHGEVAEHPCVRKK
jgi:hypothetical protein